MPAPAYIPQADPYSIPTGFKTTTTPQGGTAYQDTAGNLYTRDATGFKLQTSLPSNGVSQTVTTGQTAQSPGGATSTSIVDNPNPMTNVAAGSGYVAPAPAGTAAAPAPNEQTPAGGQEAFNSGYLSNITSSSSGGSATGTLHFIYAGRSYNIPTQTNSGQDSNTLIKNYLTQNGIVGKDVVPVVATPGQPAPLNTAQPQTTPGTVPTNVPPPPASGAPATTTPTTAPGSTSQGSLDATTLANLPNLAPGASGDQVKTLQNYLISQGYNIADGATGFYGAETKAAVTAWQKANGIDAQGNPGYFGPISKAFLGKQGSGGSVDEGGSMPTGIPASSFYKSPNETIDQYNARVAKLFASGDTSTPEGAAGTALAGAGATTTPNDFASDPVAAVTNSYNQVFQSMGLPAVSSQIKNITDDMSKMDSDLQDKIQVINENPWISEALRSKEIVSETDKTSALKGDLSKNLTLYQSIYDKGVQSAQFVVTQAMAVFKQQQQFDQNQTMQAIKTADTISVNNAKGADLTPLEKNYLYAVQNNGFTGSLADYNKELQNKVQPKAKDFAFSSKQLTTLQSLGLDQNAADNILNGIESGVPFDQLRQNMKEAGYDPGVLDKIMYFIDPAANKPGA